MYLAIRALSQHLQQLELRGVGFLTALLHVVTDVDLLQDAVILEKHRQTSCQCAVSVSYRTVGITVDGGDLQSQYQGGSIVTI